MLENKEGGFSLIEICVVLVILGVITAIALPNLFSQVKRHRAQEAMNTLTMMRSAMETCGVANSYLFSSCVTACSSGCTWTNLNMADPSNATFTYTWPTTAQDNYVMKASGPDGDITMTRTSSGITCAATNSYKGMC
jgi:prepilin-type N-terminal cleavage/methylation domain-containing protein